MFAGPRQCRWFQFGHKDTALLPGDPSSDPLLLSTTSQLTLLLSFTLLQNLLRQGNKTTGTRNNYPPRSVPVGWKWISSVLFLLILSWVIRISALHSGLRPAFPLPAQQSFPAQADLSFDTSSQGSLLRTGPSGSGPGRPNPRGVNWMVTAATHRQIFRRSF